MLVYVQSAATWGYISNLKSTRTTPAPNRPHQLIELTKLLIYKPSASPFIPLLERDKNHDKPLILSSLSLSNLSPTHVSPSSFCAYSCHSVKKPIYHR